MDTRNRQQSEARGDIEPPQGSGATSSPSADKKALGERMRCLPQISQLLQQEQVVDQLSRSPRPLVMRGLRESVDALRERILAGSDSIPGSREEAIAWIADGLPSRIEAIQRGKLRRVINGTGVVLNTNLGRAPLCQRALDKIASIASGYTNLEMRLEDRKRGGRMEGIERLMEQLVGAPAAYVVNNNAAAVLLALSTLAKGKEAIISRGELVEIGGSFRIPEVMEAAGVTLREVGTTNRTHLRDYEAAIGPNTGLLLKVHQSNYAIQGFTSEVSLEALVALGREHDIPVMNDLGSGLLIGLDEAGLSLVETPWDQPHEPTLTEVLASGVDVVTCSGDKLLGGPQAGILLGNPDWIQAAARQPLTRALRVDKLTLGALEATLQVYAEEGAAATKHIPAWAHLTRTMEALQDHGETLLGLIGTPICVGRGGDESPLHLQLEEATAPVGGGSLPSAQLPTLRLAIQHPFVSVESLDRALRTRSLPMVGLRDRGRLLLDLRTLHPLELPDVAAAVRELASCLPSQPSATRDGE